MNDLPEFTIASQIELWLRVKAKQDGDASVRSRLLKSGKEHIGELVIQMYQDMQSMSPYDQHNLLEKEFEVEL